MIQGIERTSEGFGKACQMPRQVDRDWDKACFRCCDEFGKTAVPMEAEDAHVAAEVLSPGTAWGAFTTGLSRPDDETLATFPVAGANFVA